MKEENKYHQPKWQRIVLLVIIGYEAAGCLLGGGLLILAPDGSYMEMPVSMMNGVFRDFLFPGIILFGMGVLSVIAFITILRKVDYDWIMAGLSLGGLLIWFVVEIIILKELHWLHLMWGLPVLLGWVLTIPFIISRQDTVAARKALLIGGIFSSLWYVAINIAVPTLDNSYHAASQTVSELSAIGAPTRITWVLLAIFYPLLCSAFGWGVRITAGDNRLLRMVGSLVIFYSIFNFYWPPMHQREVIAEGGSITDILHITWAIVTLLIMMLLMGLGAAALGKPFRLFTAFTFLLFIVFGILIGIESPGIAANIPTPHLGLWERINIAAFMIWIIGLSGTLLHRYRHE